MILVTEIEAYKGLASAVLLSAYINIIRHHFFEKEFVDSEWCLDLCDMAGVVHSMYVKKAYELADEYKATTKRPLNFPY